MKKVLAFALLAAASTAYALSAEEVKQYRSGAGMGYAKAAELNHFPGPMHVLELADRLNLTPEQRNATRQLMDAHKADARAIGAKRVDAERASHRRMRALLTEEQVKRYDALRGYSSGSTQHQHKH